ncbi:FAD-binding protein [Streptomyces sp. NPDC055103]
MPYSDTPYSDTLDIRVTDSSLRDGSHAKRHQFTGEDVRSVVAALDDAGVPVIEVTHGDGLGGSSFNYGFSKTPEQELIRIAAETARRARIAFLMLPGLGVKDDILAAQDNGASICRIATHCTEADIAVQHFGLARERGLEKLAPEQRATMRRAGLPTYGLTITSKDFRRLNMVGRTWSGRRTAARVGGRAVKALLSGQRLLSLGEALIARMRHSLDTLGGDLWLSAPLTGLVEEDGRVTGVRVVRGGRDLTIRATGGVVLASGGFSHDQRLREKHLPAPTSTEWSAAAEGQTGDALELATALGAGTDLMDKVWGAPSVVVPEGRPFFLVADRGVPGMVIVDGAGDRYANEAAPYHEFVDAMYAHDKPGASTVPSWLILDATAKSRYLFMGLFPGQPFPKAWLETGFVKKAATVEELAVRIDVAPERLRATVDRFNGFARAGRDEDFHRGDSVYDRYYGDPTLPNPNLAPLEKGPFHAIPVHPGDIGTKGGLVTDATARVLREDGTPIDGLYASGNVSAAVMGETYPGPGATIGPAMTFSWLAVNDIARTRADRGNR